MRFRLLAVLMALGLIAVGCGSDDATANGGLPDAITLSPEDPDAPLAITFGGYFFADDDGPRLCAGLAESFPPQCSDEIVAIEASLDEALDQVRDAAADDAPDPVRNEGDVWWTDDWVNLSGTLQANRLVLD